jgi:hypothetical protein
LPSGEIMTLLGRLPTRISAALEGVPVRSILASELFTSSTAYAALEAVWPDAGGAIAMPVG